MNRAIAEKSTACAVADKCILEDILLAPRLEEQVTAAEPALWRSCPRATGILVPDKILLALLFKDAARLIKTIARSGTGRVDERYLVNHNSYKPACHIRIDL